MYDYIIIGAGLCGSVMARSLAEKGNNILILERRNQIAGHIFDEMDQNGILIQKFGPHIFHTNNEKVYSYITKYHDWKPFKLQCKVWMKGKFTPSPFNFTTIDQYYSPDKATNIKTALQDYYPGKSTVSIVELLQSENTLIKEYAEFLFESDYSLYTAKQWGIKPSEIDVSVLKRVPVRLDYQNMYFDDKYECMPQNGYTSFVKSILNYPKITVKLGVNSSEYFKVTEDKVFFEKIEVAQNCKLIYTGAIDELFDYCNGELPYRSLVFKYKTFNTELYQEAPVVAYPEDPNFTRATEFKQLPVQDIKGKSTVAFEYPIKYSIKDNNDRYYPIPTKESAELYLKYKHKADSIKNLILCGRLADFKYYNMDRAIERCFELLNNLK